MHDDFNVKLKPIKRRDGSISELFPANLRELFSCDGKQHCPVMDFVARINNPKADRVFQLIKEHNLRPLEKHSENLSRFLSFIGKPPAPLRAIIRRGADVDSVSLVQG